MPQSAQFVDTLPTDAIEFSLVKGGVIAVTNTKVIIIKSNPTEFKTIHRNDIDRSHILEENSNGTELSSSEITDSSKNTSIKIRLRNEELTYHVNEPVEIVGEKWIAKFTE